MNKIKQAEGIQTNTPNFYNRSPQASTCTPENTTKPKAVTCEFQHILGNITPRELETLYWAANGLSAKKTADYLNMSVHTIHSYRKSIIRKLQANSITHAVYLACSRGFI